MHRATRAQTLRPFKQVITYRGQRLIVRVERRPRGQPSRCRARQQNLRGLRVLSLAYPAKDFPGRCERPGELPRFKLPRHLTMNLENIVSPAHAQNYPTAGGMAIRLLLPRPVPASSTSPPQAQVAG
jgi:hypothetical protein